MLGDMSDSSSRGGGYHEQPDVVWLHRTIGGYITAFSELTAIMRVQINDYLAPVEQEYPPQNKLLDVLFASMAAKPIADSFFSLSTAVGDLDESDAQIRRQLRRCVDQHIVFRNDIAHAEWSIGWENADTGEVAPPAAFRIKTMGGVPQISNVAITANGIATRINELNRLRRSVMLYGTVCRSRQRGDTVRVSDRLALGTAEIGSIPVERQ